MVFLDLALLTVAAGAYLYDYANAGIDTYALVGKWSLLASLFLLALIFA